MEKEYTLHYCDVCGSMWMQFTDEPPERSICETCGKGKLIPVPKEYMKGVLIDEDKKQEFMEKYVKSSPNFSQYYFDRRDEIKAENDRKYNAIKARMAAMKAMKENAPKCPICGSTDIKKISTTTKVLKTLAFGMLGAIDDAGKTWICNNCESKF